MDSTESERSLSGISLPQWMKSKIADRYDLDQSTFSPPSEDDSFFFIRYPKAKSVEPQPLRSSSAAAGDPVNYRSINEVLQNHTVPCRQFIPQAKTTPHELGLRKINDPPLGRIKSTGTDDGFTGEGAACGHSVVAVAHQMISGKLNISHKSYSDDENLLVNNLSVNRTTIVRQRRNSKSLPASPQGSPKMLRRNPYFTNILLGSTDKLENGAETSGKSGWLTNILGVRDSHEDLHSNTTTTDDHIQFSDQEDPLDSPPLKPKVGQTFKAKPSELREMNFWSPTSM